MCLLGSLILSSSKGVLIVVGDRFLLSIRALDVAKCINFSGWRKFMQQKQFNLISVIYLHTVKLLNSSV